MGLWSEGRHHGSPATLGKQWLGVSGVASAPRLVPSARGHGCSDPSGLAPTGGFGLHSARARQLAPRRQPPGGISGLTVAFASAHRPLQRGGLQLDSRGDVAPGDGLSPCAFPHPRNADGLRLATGVSAGVFTLALVYQLSAACANDCTRLPCAEWQMTHGTMAVHGQQIPDP